MVSIDGYHEVLSSNSQDYVSILGFRIPIQQISEALLAGRPYSVNAIRGMTPTYGIGGIQDSLAVILSNDEFTTFEAVEVITFQDRHRRGT